MANRPIITLTTDFGLNDHFVGTIKGVILAIAPEIEIVDISHSVQAFDVRFNTLDLDKVVAHLKSRYGKPTSETKDSIEQVNKPPKVTYKVLWEQGGDKALLSSLSTGKRGSLSVSRGNFEDEIYRVK